MAKKEDEKRVCVRCYQEHDGKAQFCIKCAAPLVNRCTDDRGMVSSGCNKVNPPDAAYCSTCGMPTTFNREGLVKGWFDELPID